MSTDWLVNSKENSYIRVCNSSGKQWLFPVKNVALGSLIFQPSSTKGRLLKRYLIAGSYFKLLYKIKYKEEYLALDTLLANAIKEAFGIEKFEFSAFLGTPGVHQKTVLQIFDDNIIYGYVKITDNECVYNLFNSEEKILSKLKSKGVKSIPVPLLIERGESYAFYIQTTEKTANSHEPVDFTEVQLSFLAELCKKTEELMRYEESAFYRNIHMLDVKKQFSKISITQERKFVQTEFEYALKLLDRKYNGKLLKFSVAHRDFTPWNMCVDNGRLFVFDWEYSSTGYFPMVDLIHYLIQSKAFDTTYGNSGIVGYLQRSEEKLSSYCNKYTAVGYRDLMIAYLLDFIAQYLTRNVNYISDMEMKGILLRSELLKYYSSLV